MYNLVQFFFYLYIHLISPSSESSFAGSFVSHFSWAEALYLLHLRDILVLYVDLPV